MKFLVKINIRLYNESLQLLEMSIPLRPNDVNGFLHRASSIINRFNRVDSTTPLINDLQGFIKRTKSIKDDLKKIEVQLLQGQETNKLMTAASENFYL